MTRGARERGHQGEAGRIGAGSAVGAIIGGIIGGVKGALLGVLIGGGGTMVATEGKDVTLPAGTHPARAHGHAAGDRLIGRTIAECELRLQHRRSLRGFDRLLSTSRSVWRRERNHASNCDGGG